MAHRKTVEIRSLVYAAVCLALCLILPMVTGSIPTIGKSLSPMHFPVLLCGFIAGPLWGGVVGVLAPFLRFLTAGVPAVYPNAIRMAAELSVYGIAAGLFYRYLPKKPFGIFCALLCAQFFGRLAWGLAQFLMSLLDPTLPFTPEMIVAMTVTPATYGILLQILLIPPIVVGMQRARFISKF